MGSIDEQLGRKPEAIASYSRALAIKPDLEDAKRGLERLTLREGTALPAPLAIPEQRLETLEDATKPASLQLLLLRGRANKQAKLYDAAFTDFSQALTSKSQSSLQPNRDKAAV